MPPGHDDQIVPVRVLARCERDAGRLAAARTLLEDSLVRFDQGGHPAATIRFELAQVRWRQGDREDARALAIEARTRLARKGPSRELDEVEAWLAKPR